MNDYASGEHEVVNAHTLPDGEVVEGLELSGLYLRQCWVDSPPNPRRRSVFRDIRAVQLRHFACNVEGALFQNVFVDGLQGGGSGGRGPSFLRGCVFDHVTIRGRVSGLVVKVGAHMDDGRVERRYFKDNLRLYRSIDWALDISEAVFSTFTDFAGVPASLVRRDPETQFILTADAAQRVVELESSIWSLVARDLMSTGVPSCVAAVGGTGERRAHDLEEANALRSDGLLA